MYPWIRCVFTRHLSVAATAGLFALLLLASACHNDDGIGGPLPTLPPGWAEAPEEAEAWIPSAVATTATAPTDTPLQIQPDPSGIGDQMPVSRALTAKMLALAFHDMTDIDAMDYEITFTDVPPDAWYSKYINAASVQGLMAGGGTTFMPDDPLTLGQAYSLLQKLDPLHPPGILLTDDNKDRPVSYALWVELYKTLLDSVGEDQSIYEAFGIERAGLIILSAACNNPALKEGQLVADSGAYSHTGMQIDDYIDREITVFHKDKEIIALVAVTHDTPTLRNVYITDADSTGISLFTGGTKRFYAYGKDCPTLTPDEAGSIGDVTIDQGTALFLSVTYETLTGTVMRTTSEAVELKEWGLLPIDPQFKTYSVADGALKWRGYNHILVGTDITDFYVRDGRLCAGLITQNSTPELIRVVIGTSGYAGLVHKSITVTAGAPFTVWVGGEEKTYEAGRRFNVSDIENTDLWGAERLYIKSTEENGTLQLVGLKRSGSDNASPRYRGIIEIAREDGGYSVVNELSLEEYLYAVVPSEMPSGYGAEASKVQAVTARSYAYNQYYENRFHAYGGHVDDSVSSQVYNNIPENNTSIQAVEATRGQCLTYNGRVISANFFSTSGGMTANSGEVWASGGRFPVADSPYLKSIPQYEGASPGDLRQEEAAAIFYKDMTVQANDSAFSWFRWQTRMSAEELAASINAALAKRYQANPSMIKTRQANGAFRSRPVETIGDLLDITVARRGAGGNVMEMILTGTDAVVSVSTEYNIRLLLSPARQAQGSRDIPLTRADGSTVNNYALMPSAFFVFDKETDEAGRLQSVTFFGGGNGHGVGMSQNGAKGLIDKGYTFEAVLSHFYPGTAILKMY